MKKSSLNRVPSNLAFCFEVLGDWWGLLIARDLLAGLKRFSDLQGSLGIARNILSRRLRTMEANGLLTRTLYCSTPPRYEYHLTDQGRQLSLLLVALAQTGDALSPAATRPDDKAVMFRHRRTLAPLKAVIVESRTGRQVDVNEIALAAGEPQPAGREAVVTS